MSLHLGRILPPAIAPIAFRDIAGGLRAMRSGRTSTDFIAELQYYFQARHCHLLSSGKAALALILRALKELHPDKDEVLIPAFTCWSVPAAIYRAGLKIRICDVEPETLDFEYRELARQLSSPRLLCVIATHLYGVTADIPKVRELVRDRNIPIVEDAAQAMGGERAGQKAGTMGDVGFFSLERGKAFSTVKGGIIVTNSTEIGSVLQTRLEAVPAVGRKEQWGLALYAAALAVFSRPWLYAIPKSLPFLRLGETLFEPDFPIRRLSDFQAGMAAGWQHRLQAFRQLRRQNSAYLFRQGVKPCCSSAALASGLLRYPVLMPDHAEKTELLHQSDRQGLGCANVYPGTVDSIAAVQGSLVGGTSKKAQAIVERMITLPVHPQADETRLAQIAGLFKSPRSHQASANLREAGIR